MRVFPLHNISQPGQLATYPNMFQLEDAPPPAPDKKMQPDMRNRVEAQTDTRHVIEYFNPTSRMETNAPNRTNTYHPTNIEMGRDRQRASGKQPDLDPTRDYQEILGWLREQQQLQESREQAYQRARELREQAKKLETPDDRDVEALSQRDGRQGRVQERTQEIYDYYYLRGVEAYKRVENMRFEPEYSRAV